MKVVFDGENAQDAGGLTKEWVRELFIEMSEPAELDDDEDAASHVPLMEPLNSGTEMRYGLCSGKNNILYKFLGRVIGKALWDEIPIFTKLNRFLLKCLVGEAFELDDLQTFDK